MYSTRLLSAQYSAGLNLFGYCSRYILYLFSPRSIWLYHTNCFSLGCSLVQTGSCGGRGDFNFIGETLSTPIPTPSIRMTHYSVVESFSLIQISIQLTMYSSFSKNLNTPKKYNMKSINSYIMKKESLSIIVSYINIIVIKLIHTRFRTKYANMKLIGNMIPKD